MWSGPPHSRGVWQDNASGNQAAAHAELLCHDMPTADVPRCDLAFGTPPDSLSRFPLVEEGAASPLVEEGAWRPSRNPVRWPPTLAMAHHGSHAALPVIKGGAGRK